MNQKLICLVAITAMVAQAGSNEITFKTADNVKIYGDYVPAQGKSRGLITLFHQASGSRLEYAKIAPRLNKMGFATIAIDQRSGGSQFGGVNKTATENGYASYLAALPDLEATVKYAKTTLKAPRVIIWGSSYSSALVFLLAAKNKDVAGLLAFSPDEYLGKPTLVKDAAKQVTTPVFITSAASEADAAKQILNATSSQEKNQFIPKGAGMHGSSVLADDTMKAEYWVAVEKFLARFK